MGSVLVVAHRFPGTAEGCAAFTRAGAEGFELDIKLSRRGVVVSHYLPFLQIHGWLQHDGRRFRWRDGPPFDPTLAEAVALVPPSVQLLLDPKEGRGRRRRLVGAAAAATRDVDRGRFVVSTGRPDEGAAYRAVGFRTWRTVRNRAELERVLSDAAAGDDGVSIRHTLLSEPIVAQLHERVPTVVAWTVNDAARARWLRDVGVDGITTDDVGVVAAARG